MKKFGRYVVTGELGRGGMATVYSAQDEVLDRPVAVKVLPHQSADFLARFQREAKMIAKLNHPAILPIYDYGEVDGETYLVMPQVTGGTLEGRKLGVSDTLKVVKTVADALAYAHGNNIVHRDIKPSNVLLDGEGRPFLADFGIAQLTDETQTQNVIGTPQYMAPEQWRGDTPTAATDQYQLAAMTSQLLTGQLPFESSNFPGFMYKHLNEVPTIVGVGSAVKSVLQRGMAKDQADRFDGVKQFAEALTAAYSAPGTVLINEPAAAVQSAPSVKQPNKPTETKRGRKGVWLALPLLILGLLGAGWFAFNQLGSEPEREIIIESRSVGTHTMMVIPAGDFIMGSTEEQIVRGIQFCDEARGVGACTRACCEDEAPVRTVTLDTYLIDQFPVTNENYLACMDAGDCTPPQDLTPFENPERPDHPVTFVTFEQATTYCKAQGLRLPTEAEWEKAARGLDDRIFPWGDDFEPARLNSCGASCVQAYAHSYDDGFQQTAPVGRFEGSVSRFGVSDMAGNVWEWTNDWYAPYDAAERVNPSGPADGVEKAARGGSFDSVANGVRSTDRLNHDPSATGNYMGFRCAADG